MNLPDKKITLRHEEFAAVVAICNPPANALDSAMLEELLGILSTLGSGQSPPAIVLTGAGERFFCPGGDIKEVASMPLSHSIERIRLFHRVLCALEQYPAPLVAAIRGYAVGGGLELVLFSDRAIAGRNSRFGFPEINHGLLPAPKGMLRASALLGRRATEELLYSGQLIDAERALTLGIVDEVVEVADVESRALQKAREYREKDQKLFGTIKRTLGVSGLSDRDLEDLAAHDMNAYLSRAETAEARRKFLDKAKVARD